VLHAQRLNSSAVVDPPPTAEEKEAASLLVECVNPAVLSGCGGGGRGGGRGAGGGRGRGAVTGPALPQHMNAEFTILLGKKKSALEIRDFLSGEFEPVPLAEVMAVLRAREAAGQIRLVPKPAEPVTKKKQR
jgi:hypothetical protein